MQEVDVLTWFLSAGALIMALPLGSLIEWAVELTKKVSPDLIDEGESPTWARIYAFIIVVGLFAAYWFGYGSQIADNLDNLIAIISLVLTGGVMPLAAKGTHELWKKPVDEVSELGAKLEQFAQLVAILQDLGIELSVAAEETADSAVLTQQALEQMTMFVPPQEVTFADPATQSILFPTNDSNPDITA